MHHTRPGAHERLGGLNPRFISIDQNSVVKENKTRVFIVDAHNDSGYSLDDVRVIRQRFFGQNFSTQGMYSLQKLLVLSIHLWIFNTRGRER